MRRIVNKERVGPGGAAQLELIRALAMIDFPPLKKDMPTQTEIETITKLGVRINKDTEGLADDAAIVLADNGGNYDSFLTIGELRSLTAMALQSCIKPESI